MKRRQCINCGFIGDLKKHVCAPIWTDNSDLKYLKKVPSTYVPGQFTKPKQPNDNSQD